MFVIFHLNSSDVIVASLKELFLPQTVFGMRKIKGSDHLITSN